MEPITIDHSHPFWRAIESDDDDWCAGAATNYANHHLKGAIVVVRIEPDYDARIVGLVVKSVAAFAATVTVELATA